MGETIQFPSLDERCRDLDESVGAFLREEGYGAEVVAWILSEWERRLKACFPSWGCPEMNLTLPAEALEAVGRAMARRQQFADELTLKLGAQLLLAVVELSAAQFATSAPSTKIKGKVLTLVLGAGTDQDAPADDASK
ncbi:MAG: hypothetical protein ACLPX7_02550 [Xanthobacteraceae bacterium]